jgi:putative sterol carrier protein
VDEAPTDDDAIETFFTGLEARGHEPLLQRASGTIRFDVTDGGQAWLVDIDHGTVRVSHRRASGDAVVHMDRATLRRVVTGECNAMAGLLRGVLTVDGDAALLMMFQRMFPGPGGVQVVAP